MAGNEGMVEPTVCSNLCNNMESKLQEVTQGVGEPYHMPYDSMLGSTSSKSMSDEEKTYTSESVDKSKVPSVETFGNTDEGQLLDGTSNRPMAMIYSQVNSTESMLDTAVKCDTVMAFVNSKTGDDHKGEDFSNLHPPVHTLDISEAYGLDIVSRKDILFEEEPERKVDPDESQPHVIDTELEEVHISSTTILDIPPEIMQTIFSFCPKTDLVHSIALVCKLWDQLANDPLLWKSLEGFEIIDIASLKETLVKAPLLKKLSLRNFDETSPEDLVQICDMCPDIEELDLGFCDFVCDNTISVLKQKYKKLKCLNIEGCDNVGDSASIVISGISTLTSLNLSHCALIFDDAMKQLLSKIPPLERLNIEGISWTTDQTIQELAEKHSSSLLHLYLDGELLSDEAIRHISKCTKLEALSVPFCDLLTDECLPYIKKLVHLKSLALTKATQLTMLPMINLFSNNAFTHLTTLDLSECTKAMSNEVCISIMESHGEKLTKLALRWCWDITDVGVEAIVDNCRQLVSLDLCGLDKITGRVFERIPTDLPNLVILDLVQCNKIDDVLIMSIIRETRRLERKPLVVLDYYGQQFENEDDM